MAATNRPDVLDPALLRPGRFDRRVVVDMPDIKAREEILHVHARGKPLAKNVDLELIARHTPGFSGADLENLMNEGAILAARNNKKIVAMKDLQEAIEKVSMGPQRKSMVLTKEEKEIVAYHEAGHAIIGYLLPYCDPIHKVTIISRGHALGVTWSLPEEDRRLDTRKRFLDQMTMALGGYSAEQVVFGEITTGAASDLQTATNIARYMVTQAGMSKLGPVVYGDQNHEVFLGRDFGHVKNYSEEISAKIDEEIKEFIDTAFAQAKKIIEKNRSLIDIIAKDLIKKETLNAEEFAAYFKDMEVPKKLAYTAKSIISDE